MVGPARRYHLTVDVDRMPVDPVVIFGAEEIHVGCDVVGGAPHGTLVTRGSHFSRSTGAMHRLLTLTLQRTSFFDRLPVRVGSSLLATTQAVELRD